MATIEENYNYWNHNSDWDQHLGEAWSRRWGSSEYQWRVTVLPRIQGHLPCASILEIAPGYGRWTEHLLKHCQHYHGVDLAERCIFFCRNRFQDTDAQFTVNDGLSLSAVEDESIDFCFSFESLVHANQATLSAYLDELKRVLKPEGAAFLHHSNLGSFQNYFDWTGRLPRRFLERLCESGWLDSAQWRAPDVTAPWVQNEIRARGLWCKAQETVNWGTRRPIDCFTTLVKSEPGPTETLENRRFIEEVDYSYMLWENYGKSESGL